MTTKPPKRKRAWDGDPPGAQSARERLIDATALCIARDGMTRVGIASVAEEAGVSRPTVYRYFENRDDLIMATLIRAADDFALQNHEYLGRFDDPREMAVESTVQVLQSLASDPVLQKIWRSDGSDQLDASIVAGATRPASLGHTHRSLKPLIEVAGWSEDEAHEAVEVYSRFIISLLLAPEPHRDRSELRAFLHRRLVPALGL